MQKRASLQSHSVFFAPLPSDNAVYRDKKSIRLPYAEDFPKLHYHDRYEIGICESGEGLFLSDGQYSAVREGDVIFIPPNVQHYSRSVCADSPCLCRFFYFRPDEINATLRTVSPDGGEKARLTALRIPPVIRRCDFPVAHALLLDAVNSCKSATSEPEGSAILRISLFLLEGALLCALPDAPAQRSAPRGEEQRVAEFISLHYAEDQSTPELAAMCYLSESQLRRRFVRAYGMPPIAYRNALRCRIACELLSTTALTVAEIGERVGFKSTSDLYRSFKKIYSVPPQRYRGKNT